jgi:transposase
VKIKITGGVFIMARKKGSLDYPREMKLEAMRMVEEGKSQREITKALGIRDPLRVQNWLWRYRREGVAAFSKAKGRPPKVESEQRELERLRMEVALLKKYRAELQELLLVRRNIEPSIITDKSLW